MEMHHIRYFLALSETLNLTKAAERCDVTQPALTRAIKSLEDELGGELLRRERALSHLMELGQRMLPMLRQCYETALTAKMVAASIGKGEAAPLSVAVSHTVALRPFTPMLRQLSRAAWVERFSILSDPPIARAFAEMASRPSVPHSVQSLSHAVGLSCSAFMARFSIASGESPMSLLRRVRMRHAADLLIANALSIDQVALRHVVECKGSSA